MAMFNSPNNVPAGSRPVTPPAPAAAPAAAGPKPGAGGFFSKSAPAVQETTETKPKTEAKPTPKPAPKAATTKTEVKPTDPPPVRESAEWKQTLSVQAKLRAEQQKLAAEKAAFAQQTAKERSDFEAYKKAMADAQKTDGLSLLELAKVDYDKLSARYIAGGAPSADSKLEELNAKIAEVQAQRVKDQQALVESQKKQYAQATQVAVKQLADQINGMSEKYPLVSSLKRGEQLANAIYQHYEKTGQIYDTDQAAASLETELAASIPNEFTAYAANPKFRAMMESALKGDKPKATKVKAAVTTEETEEEETEKKPKTKVLFGKKNDSWAAFKAKMAAQK